MTDDTAPHLRTTRVPVPVATRWPDGRTNAYLVGSLLVDPPAVDEDLSAAVAGADPPVEHVAVTHAHADHVGGVAHYAAETGATVWAHAGHVDRFVDAAGVDPDRTFRDGDAVGPTTALATPGHAPDHVSFAFVGPEGPTACCGDLAVAEGSVAVVAPEGDMTAYLDSLRRLRNHDGGPDRLLPGHGPPIGDPSTTLTRIVDHRLDRERRVLGAVEAGAGDLDAVLEAAYDKDLTGVEDLARRTVVAHLEKLAAEGQVVYDADDGTVRRTSPEP